MLTPEIIKARLRGQPFVPLRIVTSAGQTFDVPRPDLVLVGQRELIVGAASKKDPSVFDGVTRVAIMHVTALQDLPSPAGKSDNGQTP
jgi:hypothetical protein